LFFGNTTASVFPIGYIESTHKNDAIRVVCAAANTEWVVASSIGNLTIV